MTTRTVELGHRFSGGAGYWLLSNVGFYSRRVLQLASGVPLPQGEANARVCILNLRQVDSRLAQTYLANVRGYEDIRRLGLAAQRLHHLYSAMTDSYIAMHRSGEGYRKYIFYEEIDYWPRVDAYVRYLNPHVEVDVEYDVPLNVGWDYTLSGHLPVVRSAISAHEEVTGLSDLFFMPTLQFVMEADGRSETLVEMGTRIERRPQADGADSAWSFSFYSGFNQHLLPNGCWVNLGAGLPMADASCADTPEAPRIVKPPAFPAGRRIRVRK